MKILLTGGGTGGHITPLLAVAHELKKAQPNIELIYVGELGSKFADLTAQDAHLFSRRHVIFAGKFRRYNGESWLRRILDLKTNALNIRDAFYVVLGILQALLIMVREHPRIVFVKGGYVGMPVGLAAAALRIPYVTHDSDTVPGLANRVISRWARMHATGMPTEYYAYPKSKMRYTGIPVSDKFQRVTLEKKDRAKVALGIPTDMKVILVTGGSQGSIRLNNAMAEIVPELLRRHTDVFVLHHVGRGNEGTYGDFTSPRLRVESFIMAFFQASAAADVVVARAGANTIAELSIQEKAAILIPSPFLAGGHQLKNAEHLQSQYAALVLHEMDVSRDPNLLLRTITNVLEQPKLRTELAQRLSTLSKPFAARELANTLLEVAEK
jgi:UDP-N-acetylglucosamine--N-acetylmuramyl-(pentapeptide) pyrophosphoryl-undecaprenol N-acetylglucosamine transferase